MAKIYFQIVILGIVSAFPVYGADGPNTGVRTRNIYGVTGSSNNIYGVRRQSSSNIFGVRNGTSSRSFGVGRPNFVSRERGAVRSSSGSGANSRNEERPYFEMHPMNEREARAELERFEAIQQQGSDLDNY